MTSLARMAKSNVLDTRDYEIVLDSVMRMSGESEWLTDVNRHQGGSRRESPAVWWAFNRVDTPHDERTVQYAALATAMLAATTQFAISSCLRPFERRLTALETRFSEAEAFGAHAARVSPAIESARIVREASEHLTAILAQFEKAFDGIRPHATLLPLFDDDGRYVRLVLDASGADEERLTSARESGGRARFIDALAEAMPARLYRSIDLEFVFAHEG